MRLIEGGRLKVIRGSLALVLALLILILGDPVQRLIIGPLGKLRPSSRTALWGRWLQFMKDCVVWPVRAIGGARLPESPSLPGDEGTLIIMNHQSILDLPLLIGCVPRDVYPIIIARKRYFRGVPLVSHLVRLYQYPGVDPRANSREMKKSLAQIRDAARNRPLPLALYPEGTRTKDGEIGPFRPTGMKLILKQRPWKVYVLVGDGYWKMAKMMHFLRGMEDIQGRLELAGVFEWTDPEADSEEFIEELRQTMVDRLAEMRAREPAST